MGECHHHNIGCFVLHPHDGYLCHCFIFAFTHGFTILTIVIEDHEPLVGELKGLCPRPPHLKHVMSLDFPVNA